MANIKVTIVDSTRLRLQQDAKEGDIIDLRDVNQVDTSMILDQINQAKDQVYREKVAMMKASLAKEYELNNAKALQQVVLEKERLKSETRALEQKLNHEFQLKIAETKAKYEKDMASLQHAIRAKEKEVEYAYENKIQKFENQLKTIAMEKDQEYIKKIHELESGLKDLNQTKELTISKLEIAHKETIYQLKEELSQLERSRANLNIKTIGEDLEKWCDNEFQSQALFGFDNIVWEKDNVVIRSEGETKGTKGDFIYKVYATNEKKDNELLTSAILEMKSESPDSKIRQTNAQFYKKLDDDRHKKKVEYALLVSELEWDTTNDVPIRKVNEYDKMFVVRPQYFMSFLSLITSLGMKYKDILLSHEEKRLEFKDLENIINEFEEMKNDILNKTVKYIEDHMKTILKEAANIQAANTKIINSANIIIERHINTVINKIDNFNINRITKKIENVAENNKN